MVARRVWPVNAFEALEALQVRAAYEQAERFACRRREKCLTSRSLDPYIAGASNDAGQHGESEWQTIRHDGES